MNFTMSVNEGECISNLRNDRPNFPDSKARNGVMNENCSPNSFVVIIQIQRTELHVDKDVRSVRKVAEVKDFDDVLMPAIAQLLDRP